MIICEKVVKELENKSVFNMLIYLIQEEEYLAKGGLLLKMGLYSEDYIEKMAENNGLTDEEVKEK